MYDFDKAKPHAIGTTADIAAVLNPPSWREGASQSIRQFVTDSRQVGPGDVFVAIEGARVDGHRFVDQAFERGAVASIVSKLDDIQQRQDCLQVADTINALGYLAACHRLAMPCKVIGLTGSVGKTTTKDLLHGILAVSHKARKSEGNFNSTIGLPMQLLALQPDDAWMVAEMGMSYPGEIRTLARIAKPDIALFLSVQAVHSANFDSVEDIARAKAELVEELSESGILVYNLDDPLVTKYSQQFPGRCLNYGTYASSAHILARIEAFPTWQGTHFDLRLPRKKQPLSLFLPMVGRFNVHNAVAACTTALAAGVATDDLSYALRKITVAPHRSSLSTFKDDILLVDDSYNASPYAVQQVLRSFASLSPHGFRWLILGDMLELGADENHIHRILGKTIGGYGFDRVSLIGALSEHTYRGVQQSQPRHCQVEHFADVDAALAQLDPEVPPHARIWIKASRGIRLEKLADHLIAEYAVR